MKIIIKITIYLVIGLLIYLYIFKIGGSYLMRIVNERNLPDTISKTKEKDYNIIKDFAGGMKTNEYLDILSFEGEVLEGSSVKYKKIKYDFNKFLKYSEIEKMILNINNSNVVETEIIGKSVDNRNIYSLSIGYGDKVFLISAGIHAREVANPLYVMKYISELLNKYENNDKDTIKLLNNIKIVVIPVVNPDGYEVILFGAEQINNKDLYIYKKRKDIDFQNYKANANGVDLNRNFPSQHGGLYYKNLGIHKSVSKILSVEDNKHFPGYNLGSEPETKALMYWFNKYINESYAYVDIHSAGRVIYSGKPNLSSDYNKASLKLAYLVSNINKYEAYDEYDEEVGYGTDGTSTDYASELLAGFKFSYKTGRLGANSYKKPLVKNTDTGIITLETLKESTIDIEIIKKEYYDKKISEVFFSLLNSYK